MSDEFKTDSKLEKILKSGNFAVTGECGPPRGADAEVIRNEMRTPQRQSRCFQYN